MIRFGIGREICRIFTFSRSSISIYHIRNDRHAEALRDEPGDHLILLDLIRDIGRGVDLRKHIVDDVPQPRTVRILDKQIAELLLQLRDGVAQARLRYSDRGR